jgi:adenosylmethionine-8-amino-7-oxononanoate aminotransferase
VPLGYLATSQPDPHCAIQPAGPRGQRTEQRLAQQQALTRWSYRPKSQFASLISPMQDNAPGKGRPFLPVPFEHPNQLLAQGIDYKGRWHVPTSGKGSSDGPEAILSVRIYAECGPLGPKLRRGEPEVGRSPLIPPPLAPAPANRHIPPTTMNAHQFPESHVFYRKLRRQYPRIIRGQGCYLYDAEGRRYLDGCGGAYVSNVGHGVSEIADALACQAATLGYVSGTTFTHDAVEQFAAELAELSPGDLDFVYPLASGSEAVEAGLKLARQYWVEAGRPAKHKVIAFTPSYHGNTLLALSASSREPYRTVYREWVAEIIRVPAPYSYRCNCQGTAPLCSTCNGDAVEAAIAREGADSIAALIGEPVGGSSTGASVPRAEYWQRIRSLCDRYEILLVADEVLTGAGRTGTWSALEPYGIVPDLMIVGKGIAGGYVPLSAVIASRRLAEALARGSGVPLHAQTFSHHATLCAAGVATIRYLRRHRLIERCAAMGQELHRALERLRSLPSVGDVRGRGLLAGIELVADRDTRRPFPGARRFAESVAAEALGQGLVVWPNSGHLEDGTGDLVMLAPPFVIDPEQISELVTTLARAIERVSDRVEP